MLTNRQLFLQHVGQTSDQPLMLEIERAEGIYMYDNRKQQYIDLISGVSVNNIGHRHPAVVEAIEKWFSHRSLSSPNIYPICCLRLWMPSILLILVARPWRQP